MQKKTSDVIVEKNMQCSIKWYKIVEHNVEWYGIIQYNIA